MHAKIKQFYCFFLLPFGGEHFLRLFDACDKITSFWRQRVQFHAIVTVFVGIMIGPLWIAGRISNTFIFHLEWRIILWYLALRRFYTFPKEHFSFPSVRCRDTMAIYKMTVTTANQLSFLRMRDWLSVCLSAVSPVYCFPRSAFCCVHTVEHFYTYQIFCVARSQRASRETQTRLILYRIFASVRAIRAASHVQTEEMLSLLWRTKSMLGWIERMREVPGREKQEVWYMRGGAGLLFGPIRACSL
jgi:hypothetical protein